MSIDVSIKQKGFFKKTIPFNVILGNQLAYGATDGLRLIPNQMDEEVILYDPQSIGRGFGIKWNENEKNEITLRLLNPTTEGEMRAFFDCLRRITSFWNCKMTVDGIEEDINEYLSQEDDLIAYNHKVIKEVSEKIVNGESQRLTLYSTMWPLVIGKDEAEQFVVNPHLFSSWMHEQQIKDYYYAKPQFFQTEEGIKGIYALTEDCPTIMPNTPWVPLGIENPETGQRLECDHYEIALYSTTEDKTIAMIPYERLFTLGPDYLSYYDGGSILVENVGLEELNKLKDCD